MRSKKVRSRSLVHVALASIAFAYAGVAHATISDFTLLDHTGKSHHLGWYGDQDAVVIYAHALNEASRERHAAELAAVAKRHADSAVAFFALNTQSGLDRETLAADAAVQQAGLPVLQDDSQLVAENLGLTRNGEVVIVNPKTRAVAYRGTPAGLSAALDALLAGQPLPDSKAASGSAIAYPAKPAVSYTEDIVPILERNCVSCHNEGGIGPWAMTSHAMVRGWSPMMREVVMNRRMPPGQIDHHVGKPIMDVAGLTIDEKRQLITWIDAGAPMDGTLDPLAELKVANPKFTLGEPDMVFKVTPQEVPATGVLDYRYVPVELGLDRDIWLSAMEFVPGDRKVLHHVIAYLTSPGDRSSRSQTSGVARGESIGGFAPGKATDVFRDNSGRLIPAGSNLLLQMHYTTWGKPAVDETEIGLYLHDAPPRFVMSGGVAGQRRFLVPPHAKDHQITGEQEFERDALLYSMNPHMHSRGKYMNYSAVYPDGREELLLSVPRYDFNWQFGYELVEPLFLPAGSKLITRGAMDNSDRNPANPDPTVPVHFGLQTKHEMFFGFTTYRYVGHTPNGFVAEKSAAPEGEAATAEAAGR
ncbi:MAG: hypothetical protein AAF515_11520 [Pseudomonadota bacterium]